MPRDSERAAAAAQAVDPHYVRPLQVLRAKPVQSARIIDSALSRSQKVSSEDLPLEKARKTWETAWGSALDKAERLGMDDLSGRNIADRYFHQPDVLLSKWRLGKKPMPAAALLVLPAWLLVELINFVLRSRGMKEYEP